MKSGIQKISQSLGQLFTKNSPTILTGMSVAGLVTTVILAVRATPKAIQLVDDEFDLFNPTEESTQPTNIEVVKVAWRCYVPAAIMGGITVACLISANSINLRRNAALASVYSLTEATLKEYQAKVVETIGEGKAKKIKDELAKEKIVKNPPTESTVIITGRGDTLCYDSYSGRYFKSDIEDIRKIENNLNRDLMNEMTISLNDMYYAIGLANIKLGDELGWSIEDGLIDFQFSSQLTEGGVPCLVVDYDADPLYAYKDRR